MRAILLLTLVAMATARLAPLHTNENRIPGSYIVKLKAGSSVDASIASVMSAAAHGEVEILHKYTKVFPGFSARLTDRMLQILRESDAVEYIDEDGVAYASEVASWGLDRIDQIGLPLDGEYDQVLGDGAGVDVYVIDTGINIDHVDYLGRSFIAFDSSRFGNGADCNGHGSHCSGTVAGTEYGVAKGANVHGVRVLGCTGSGSWAAVISGCDYVAANATLPAVASMSLGGSATDSLDAAVQGMIDVGITVAVAAGNEDTNACSKSPARVLNAITVGATDIGDVRAYFSNYGECVDIFAPGVDITSAWIGSPVATRTISGTSMACPHVAGAAAVLLANDPALTPDVVKETLQLKAIAGAVSDPVWGSPNLLLYMGLGSGGGYIPTPPPPTTAAPPPPPCVYYFTDNSGTITSPNYPSNYDNDLDCEYFIGVNGSSSGIVSISFQDFSLESSFDYLQIHDGSSQLAPQIGSWTGSDSPGSITGSSAGLYMFFHSDLSVTYRGFSATYNIGDSGECGKKDKFTTDFGTFTSPNYPEKYDNHGDCSFVIEVEAGKTITISFNDFDVEDHLSCGDDALEVYDGLDDMGERIAKLCGSKIPEPVTSSGNTVFIRFTSDSSLNGRGFQASYSAQ